MYRKQRLHWVLVFKTQCFFGLEMLLQTRYKLQQYLVDSEPSICITREVKIYDFDFLSFSAGNVLFKLQIIGGSMCHW